MSDGYYPYSTRMQEEPKAAQKPPYAVRPVFAVLGGVVVLLVAIFAFALGGPGR